MSEELKLTCVICLTIISCFAILAGCEIKTTEVTEKKNTKMLEQMSPNKQ